MSSDRLAAIEACLAAIARRLDALEAAPPPAAPARVMPVPSVEPAEIPPVRDAQEGAITTAELAERTGTNRSGWNNWARGKEPGAVRDHPQAGLWQLVGRAAAAGGGPQRLMWQQITP